MPRGGSRPGAGRPPNALRNLVFERSVCRSCRGNRQAWHVWNRPDPYGPLCGRRDVERDCTYKPISVTEYNPLFVERLLCRRCLAVLESLHAWKEWKRRREVTP